MTIGPVDIVVLHFPGSKFTGEIAPAIRDLVASGMITVIDLLFVMKETDGTTTSFEMGGLDSSMEPQFAEIQVSHSGRLLDPEDVESATEGLEPGSSAMLLVIENTWAVPFVEAVRRSGGELVDQARIPGADVEAALAAAGG